MIYLFKRPWPRRESSLLTFSSSKAILISSSCKNHHFRKSRRNSMWRKRSNLRLSRRRKQRHQRGRSNRKRRRDPHHLTMGAAAAAAILTAQMRVAAVAAARVWQLRKSSRRNSKIERARPSLLRSLRLKSKLHLNLHQLRRRQPRINLRKRFASMLREMMLQSLTANRTPTNLWKMFKLGCFPCSTAAIQAVESLWQRLQITI